MTNHLAKETSPYLQQHAHNPVDWYPWGTEAFDRARREDRPVLLSVGYSTCHWCHVMAHECFEDEALAALLNRTFVCVKVDREERPDVDAVYMQACQAMTGSGGWPLTILMTPDQKPFYAATYLPKSARRGRPGLMEIAGAVAAAWREDRQRLISTSEQVTRAVNELASRSAPQGALSPALFEGAFAYFQRQFDPKHGGFGVRPKFPSPHNLLFLMRYALGGRPEAGHMVEVTLNGMFRGGLFDHIGGGFSRYSTDERWLAPHFEKMLYDNALLAYAYAEAYQITGQALYRRVAERTLEYVLRELLAPEGGFFSAQDADSEGQEGGFYLLDWEEVRSVLGEEAGGQFCEWFGISRRGNFEGRNIPNLLGNPWYAQPNADMDALSLRLRDYRRQRMALHRDEKQLTAWNALMIAALAKCARAFGEPRYLEAARRAQAFVEDHLTQEEGRLYLSWCAGQTGQPGQLEDYAFYAWALLELYAAQFEAADLERAVQLADWMERLFGDGEAGGLFLYPADGEQLITRPKESYDGAMPSGNSMAAWMAVRLSHLTVQPRWRALAQRQLEYLAGVAQEYPGGYACALVAMLEAGDAVRQLVVCAPGTSVPPLLSRLMAGRQGLCTAALLKNEASRAALERAAPFTAGYPVPGQGTVYYLCEQGRCRAPMDEAAFEGTLGTGQEGGWTKS